MVKYWMHNGLMRAGEKGKVGGRGERETQADDDADAKISRSKGAGGLSELIRRHSGTRIRFFLLRTHYRSTILYSEAGLEEAGAALDGLYRLFDRFAEITGLSFYGDEDLKPARTRSEGDFDPGDDEFVKQVHALRDKFIAAMDDDFNTGAAISVLFDWVRLVNRFIDQQGLASGAKRESPEVAALIAAMRSMKELTNVLGLFEKPPVAGGSDDQASELLDKTVALLIDLRKQARERKDYETSDAIRDRLGELGIALLDKKEGTTWEVTS
jgi:cysteinyl-tRNA synthetase